MANKQINLCLDNFESLHCPVCGKQVIGVDADDNYCDHVLFIFVDAIGEFVHVADKMKKHTAVWENDDEWDKIEEQNMGIMDYLLDKLPDTAMLIEIETSGMACAPVTNTDYIAFDFCP